MVEGRSLDPTGKAPIMAYEVEVTVRAALLFSCTVVAATAAQALDEAKRLARTSLTPAARRKAHYEVVA
jgi:arginine utilization protein RocB